MRCGYDRQLVVSRRSFQGVDVFVAKRLWPLDDVRSAATHFVLRTYKKDGEMFLDEDPDERETVL